MAKREELWSQAIKLTEQLRQLPRLIAPRFIADDATPERLATLLGDHGGRMALLSPEGDTFDLMAGRYSAGGVSNLGVYLKGHAGDDIRVDRVSRAPEFVRDPALSIGLAVQPDLLGGLMWKPGFRGRGLLGRFLYSLPPSKLGRRKLDPPRIPQTVVDGYHRLIKSALNLKPDVDEFKTPRPHTISVGNEALVELDSFATTVERNLADGGQFEAMRDWGGKLVGAVCRIAGIFHGLRLAPNLCRPIPAIDAETMLCAIAVGEYLVPHAKAAYHMMGPDPAVEIAKRLIQWLKRESYPQVGVAAEAAPLLGRPLVRHGQQAVPDQSRIQEGRRTHPR